MKAHIDQLLQLTLTKDKQNIKTYLEMLPTTLKGPVFEEYLKELYNGNGFLAIRKGGKDDLGADILVYHPNDLDSPLLLIQAKNQKRPLSERDTKAELMKFEEKAQHTYNCHHFVIYSLNGFTESAYVYKQFNLRLDAWNEIERLIDNYDVEDKAVRVHVELFPHNQLAYERIQESWEKDHRIAAIQATGTGKSYLILRCLADFYHQRKLILAPSTYILDHIKNIAHWAAHETFFMTYAKAMNLTQEEIASLDVDFIVLDEFHRCGGDEWGKGVQAVLDAYRDAYVLGTSATPIRYLDGSRDMAEELFQSNKAVELSLAEAMVKRIVPIPTYVSALYTLEDELEHVKENIRNGEKTENEKAELLQSIKTFHVTWEKSNGIPAILKKYMPETPHKFIVFCKDKQHVAEMEWLVEKWFKEMDGEKPIKKYRVISDDPYANEELHAFSDGKRKNCVYLLFAIDKVNEGVHINDVTGVILLRPTESPIVFYQQIGRAIQSGNSKEIIIFDFVNNFRSIKATDFRHDLVDALRNERENRMHLGLQPVDIPFHIHDETVDFVQFVQGLEIQLDTEAVWDANYTELLAFNQQQGHCLVPSTFENKQLVYWTQHQRLLYKKEKLHPHRKEKLEDVGFVWYPLEYHWENRFDELNDYKKENGHCLIPNTHDNQKLLKWVFRQRTLYKAGTLEQEKIDRLNTLGFVWDPLKEEWNQQVEKLLAFKAENGHCLVPLRYPSLGKWVQYQRGRYMNNQLSDDKIERLNTIGFVWNPLNDEWEEKYQELRQFKQRYGHTRVTADMEEFLLLGSWIQHNRKHYKEGKLAKERITKLNELGFSWMVLDDIWEERFGEFNDFVATHGHARVPANCEEYPSLGKWIVRQRKKYKEGNLHPSHVERLEAAGFIWDAQAYKWDEKYQALKEFYAQHGHFKIGYTDVKQKSLNKWLARHKQLYAEGGIEEEMLQKFKSIGYHF